MKSERWKNMCVGVYVRNMHGMYIKVSIIMDVIV